VLCALGLAAAAPRRDSARTVMLRGEEFTAERLDEERDSLLDEVWRALGEPPARMRLRYEMRYSGQSFELPVDAYGEMHCRPQQLCEAFAEAHELRYGYRDEQAQVELVTIRACAWGNSPALAPRAAGASQATRSSREIVFAGVAQRATVWHGEPAPGTSIVGPALCALPQATLLVEPGWEGEVDEFGTIHLREVRSTQRGDD
jgi:N-methylhydantoinase A